MKANGVRATKVSDGTVRLTGEVTPQLRKVLGDNAANAIRNAIKNGKPLNEGAIKAIFGKSKHDGLRAAMTVFSGKGIGGKKGSSLALTENKIILRNAEGKKQVIPIVKVQNPVLAGKKDEMRLTSEIDADLKKLREKGVSLSAEEQKAMLQHTHPLVRMEAISKGMAKTDEERRAVLQDSDPSVRITAIGRGLATSDNDKERALTDDSPIVRLAAVMKGLATTPKQIKRAQYDTNAAVRNAAQALQGQNNEIAALGGKAAHMEGQSAAQRALAYLRGDPKSLAQRLTAITDDDPAARAIAVALFGKSLLAENLGEPSKKKFSAQYQYADGQGDLKVQNEDGTIHEMPFTAFGSTGSDFQWDGFKNAEDWKRFKSLSDEEKLRAFKAMTQTIADFRRR